MDTGIAQGLLGFLLYLGVVPLILRIRLGGEPAVIVAIAAVALWVLSLAALLAAGQELNFWAFSTSYWFLALCFLMAFGAIYKSISLRIVAHLLECPNQGETYAKVKRLVLEESYQERLGIIVAKRYADRTGDRFLLTAKGSYIARWARFLQTIFLIARSG